jgi:hypothetical protein
MEAEIDQYHIGGYMSVRTTEQEGNTRETKKIAKKLTQVPDDVEWSRIGVEIDIDGCRPSRHQATTRLHHLAILGGHGGPCNVYGTYEMLGDLMDSGFARCRQGFLDL